MKDRVKKNLDLNFAPFFLQIIFSSKFCILMNAIFNKNTPVSKDRWTIMNSKIFFSIGLIVAEIKVSV